MKGFWAFIKLTRPINLLFIGVNAYILKFVFENNWSSTDWFSNSDFVGWKHEVLFAFMVLSMMSIAAAGNIINDYFDIKADRINKPNRTFVSRKLKKRWAIVTHWWFNSLGLMLALALAYFKWNLFLFFIPFLTAGVLWSYSVKLKRMSLIGNIAVAFLTALVPFMFFLFYYSSSDYFLLSAQRSNALKALVVFLMFCAFILNLMRELIKDVEDLEGDKRMGCKTFPIVNGVRKSQFLITAISAFFSVVLLMLVYAIYVHTQTKAQLLLYLIGTEAILGIVLCVLVWRSSEASWFNKMSNYVKLMMLIGIIIPLIFV